MDHQDIWFFSSPVIQSCIQTLMSRSQAEDRGHGDSKKYGREYSAWVMLKEGQLSCLIWEPDPENTDLLARWEGPPPPEAIANIHTHPPDAERGMSYGDVQMAEATGFNFYSVDVRGRWVYKAYGHESRTNKTVVKHSKDEKKTYGQRIGKGRLKEIFKLATELQQKLKSSQN